jgi:hypothetical protein
MSVQIMPDWAMPKFSYGKATPKQAKAALEGYPAYFGHQQTAPVTHHRTSNINPGDMGDFVRLSGAGRQVDQRLNQPQ